MITKNEYYPFGMLIDGQSVSPTNYRYSFNTQEISTEINQNHTTAEFWEYDSRSGRRWNLDPIDQISISNYTTFFNNPNIFTDHLGLTGDTPLEPAPKVNNEVTVWGSKPSQLEEFYGKAKVASLIAANFAIGVSRYAGTELVSAVFQTDQWIDNKVNSYGVAYDLAKAMFDGTLYESTAFQNLLDANLLIRERLQNASFEEYWQICGEYFGPQIIAIALQTSASIATTQYKTTKLINTTNKAASSNILPRNFDDVVVNPISIVGSSADDIGNMLGEGWVRGSYGSKGTGWKFTKGDKSIFYHPGGGRHDGSYYGFSSGKTGKVKIVSPNYKPTANDKATIIE